MELKLSGIQPFTMLDYPGKLACIAFLPGCNFRCGYCHNSEFVLPKKIKRIRKSFIDQKVFFKFLEKRRGRLDAVVISGGEPTIHSGLVEFIKKIKSFSFLVKLDTNGSNPDLIDLLIQDNYIDFIALDIKGNAEFYEKVCKFNNVENIKRTIKIIEQNNIPYQFRSTLIKELHSEDDVNEIKAMVRLPQKIIWQTFRREGSVLDKTFLNYSGYSDIELLKLHNSF